MRLGTCDLKCYHTVQYYVIPYDNIMYDAIGHEILSENINETILVQVSGPTLPCRI